MIALRFSGEVERNNTRGLLFKAAFSGTYGVNGVGDLLNLAPFEAGANPNGITDPSGNYNLILAEPPSLVGLFSEDLGGYYAQVHVPANPTLQNIGVRIYAPGGTELATGAAYAAAVTGGSAVFEIFVPLQ